MYFSTSIIASAILALAASTTTSIAAGLATSSTSGVAGASKSAVSGAAASAVPTSGAAAGGVATHVIQVGGPNGSLTFSPENIKAAVGDLVQFQFHPKNHSVVQSTFDKPCVPIQNTMPNMTTAFYSGFMPSNASVGATSKVLTYTIRVMDAKPIWFYCAQAKHCQGGMVGAINAAATGNKTMSAFKSLAASAPENLSPGQAPGSGSGSAGSGTGSGTGTNGGGNAAQSSPAAGGAAGGAGGAGAGAGSTSTGSGAPAQQTTNAAPSSFGSQSFFGLSLGAVAAALLL